MLKYYSLVYWGPARVNSDKWHSPNCGQIATVTAKLTISDKHLQSLTPDVLKFRWATWDLPPTSWQGLFITKLFKNWRILIFNLQVGSCKYERTPVTWSQITPIKTHTYTGLQIITTLLRHFTLANFLLPFDNFCRNPTRSQPAGYKNWPTGTWLICSTCCFPLKYSLPI